MNESRLMRSRMAPRKRGEWGTERRRGSAASGNQGNRTPPRRSAASGNRTREPQPRAKIQKKQTRGAEM